MEFRGSRNQVNKEPQHRINESIRAAQVRVVGENIEPGVYPLREALAMAEAAGMDLVEISPNAEPPVCRIIDYSAPAPSSARGSARFHRADAAGVLLPPAAAAWAGPAPDQRFRADSPGRS